MSKKNKKYPAKWKCPHCDEWFDREDLVVDHFVRTHSVKKLRKEVKSGWVAIRIKKERKGYTKNKKAKARLFPKMGKDLRSPEQIKLVNKVSREHKIRSNRLKNHSKKSYKDYLLSSEWKSIRKLIIDRDNGKCVDCGSKRQLQVHHKTYRNIYNEGNHTEDLVTLCGECHRRIHYGKLNDKKELLTGFIQKTEKW